MSVTIEVLSLPVPVVLPAVHGNMRRMRAELVTVRGAILVACLVALVLLGGCGTPDRGTVTGRAHGAARPEAYVQCDGVVRNGGYCRTETRWWHETWSLYLDDGRDSGWRTVTRSEYDACPPGTTWPDCTQGRL